jgi:hypothetical protein
LMLPPMHFTGSTIPTRATTPSSCVRSMDWHGRMTIPTIYLLSILKALQLPRPPVMLGLWLSTPWNITSVMFPATTVTSSTSDWGIHQWNKQLHLMKKWQMLLLGRRMCHWPPTVIHSCLEYMDISFLPTFTGRQSNMSRKTWHFARVQPATECSECCQRYLVQYSSWAIRYVNAV